MRHYKVEINVCNKVRRKHPYDSIITKLFPWKLRLIMHFNTLIIKK